jgi:EAL domain-containing protein (putative c-di-GMP-specific phosphodiesterase class I)
LTDPAGPREPGVAGFGRGEAQDGLKGTGIDAVMHAAYAAEGRVPQVIAERDFHMVGQPIVNLATGGVVGVEALARFHDPEAGPLAWLEAAGRLGLRPDLEMLAIEGALEMLSLLAPDALLCVNASPGMSLSRRWRDVVEAAPLSRIVLEITEQVEIENHQAVNRALVPLRARGMQLAIDDAGAGYASFQHVVHLQPDIIKLDGTWTEYIDSDVARRALVSAFVRLAADLDAIVTAEAVETAEQARILTELGVQWGQGYLFGRPEPMVASAS